MSPESNDKRPESAERRTCANYFGRFDARSVGSTLGQFDAIRETRRCILETASSKRHILDSESGVGSNETAITESSRETPYLTTVQRGVTVE